MPISHDLFKISASTKNYLKINSLFGFFFANNKIIFNYKFLFLEDPYKYFKNVNNSKLGTSSILDKEKDDFLGYL